jgi:hypothetical protein
MTTPKQPARICILGGGFGGLYTALRLSQFPFPKQETPEITLVDKRDRFLFSPLLYELLTGELETWEISPPYSDLLANTNIRFVQGEVAHINPEDKKVKLDNDNTLNYDYLVLSMGGKTPLNGVQGAEKHAIAFRDIADAYQLEAKLRLLEASPADKIRIAIVGGGYSGVELACKLSDRVGEKARIRIIEQSDMILRNSSEFNRDTASAGSFTSGRTGLNFPDVITLPMINRSTIHRLTPHRHHFFLGDFSTISFLLERFFYHSRFDPCSRPFYKKVHHHYCNWNTGQDQPDRKTMICIKFVIKPNACEQC